MKGLIGIKIPVNIILKLMGCCMMRTSRDLSRFVLTVRLSMYSKTDLQQHLHI